VNKGDSWGLIQKSQKKEQQSWGGPKREKRAIGKELNSAPLGGGGCENHRVLGRTRRGRASFWVLENACEKGIKIFFGKTKKIPTNGKRAKEKVREGGMVAGGEKGTRKEEGARGTIKKAFGAGGLEFHLGPYFTKGDHLVVGGAQLRGGGKKRRRGECFALKNLGNKYQKVGCRRLRASRKRRKKEVGTGERGGWWKGNVVRKKDPSPKKGLCGWGPSA